MYVTLLTILLGLVCYIYGWYRTKYKINFETRILLTSRLKVIDSNIKDLASKFNINLRGD